MKKPSCFLLVCIFSLLVSCKKTSLEDINLMKVKEFKTNIPLPGVKISLYTCSNFDLEFGCQSTSLFATHTTDSKGEYTFTQKELNQATQAITLSKAQYWNGYGGTGERQMEPEAWVRIALTASKAYPETSIFEIQTIGELGVGGSQSFKAPIDSIINFRLIGNEMNNVTWVLYTKDPKCYYYCMRDTLAFGNLSFRPQKFEALTSSLNY
ncbi:MAG: hypothetical protein H0W62_08565 [Chitinophagales bacterium]|nr:hypothetical protein [Chitinophagales bacterium]